MTSLRVGLVVEGPTDLLVIRHLIGRHFRDQIPPRIVEFIDLQPSIDATSGSPEGGWQMVYRWCLSNTPAFREIQYFSPGIFSGNINDKQCDLILFQLDTDICMSLEGCAVGVNLTSSLSNSRERGQYTIDVLNFWLWPVPVKNDPRHIAAPCAENLETWLVAALGNEDHPEELRNSLLKLAEIDYLRRDRPLPAKIKAIAKKTSRYRPLAEDSENYLDLIRKRCHWFEHVIKNVEKQIT